MVIESTKSWLRCESDTAQFYGDFDLPDSAVLITSLSSDLVVSITLLSLDSENQ